MLAQETIIEAFNEQNHLSWRIINDGVMGGISNSRMEMLANEKGRFSGNVSLENNGGFASTRGTLGKAPTTTFSKVKIRLKGDGKKYSFRIRTDDLWDGVSYKLDFSTRIGEWEEIVLPLANFIPTWRGRQLKDVSAIDPKKIKQIGFLISDKQVGAFELLIDSIRFLE